jgi:hypothetical protein
MTGPILLSAAVGGGVSFLVALVFNAYHKARSHNRAASGSTDIWE